MLSNYRKLSNKPPVSNTPTLSIKPPGVKSFLRSKPPGGLFPFFTIITVLCFLRLKSKYDSIICILLAIPCYYPTIYKLWNNISLKIRILILFSKMFVNIP